MDFPKKDHRGHKLGLLKKNLKDHRAFFYFLRILIAFLRGHRDYNHSFLKNFSERLLRLKLWICKKLTEGSSKL